MKVFYILELSVPRLSDAYDIIPLMISERLIDTSKDYRGCYMYASGQFRSYNRHEETKNRLVLSVFVRELTISDSQNEEDYAVNKPNQIFLDGFICKPPVYRKNAVGKGNCRCAFGCKPSVWQIRLYTVYLLGTQCKVCRII